MFISCKIPENFTRVRPITPLTKKDPDKIQILDSLKISDVHYIYVHIYEKGGALNFVQLKLICRRSREG